MTIVLAWAKASLDMTGSGLSPHARIVAFRISSLLRRVLGRMLKKYRRAYEFYTLNTYVLLVIDVVNIVSLNAQRAKWKTRCRLL
jgi:hypothetical protein